MNVDEYLNRLSYTGRTDVSKETLFALQEAHLKTIAYENLDIHLGVAVGLEPPQIFNKVILEKRGGWCFELNGLLAWLLTELGFDVNLHGATVVPEEQTPNDVKAIPPEARTHVVLVVTVNGESYLTDVGFGPACTHPLPLRTADHMQNGFKYTLHQVNNFWFFENHKGLGGNFYFDEQTFDLDYFKENSKMLQTSPESHFVRTTVTYRFTDDCIYSLKGNSLRTFRPNGYQDQIIKTKEDYINVLQEYFFLSINNVDMLWDVVNNLSNNHV